MYYLVRALDAGDSRRWEVSKWGERSFPLATYVVDFDGHSFGSGSQKKRLCDCPGSFRGPCKHIRIVQEARKHPEPWNCLFDERGGSFAVAERAKIAERKVK